MDDLRNLPDTEIVDFLRRYWKTDAFVFYGVFVPNTERPDAFSGMMTRVKVPGSKTLLKYPFVDNGFVSFKVPANKKLEGKYYKFGCHLQPNAGNRCQLQMLLNTVEAVDEITYDFVSEKLPMKDYDGMDVDSRPSPVDYRYRLVKDPATGWGPNINVLMGIYRKSSDGVCSIDDIRRTDMTRLERYPRTTFRVGPLTLTAPVEGLTEGQYCLFHWKFTFNVRVNPCEIEVDETKPITSVSPEDLMAAVAKREKGLYLTAGGPEATDDAATLVYDLVFEANKFNGGVVDAQFNLTDKYLVFQHTGKPLSAATVLSFCGMIGQAGDNKNDMIAYHCQGLRQFLLSNKRTIVISNGFFLDFKIVNGQLMPSWFDKAGLPRELKMSLAHNKRFMETIIVPFDEGDKATFNGYRSGLRTALDTELNIAFFQNIGKVEVKIKDGKAKVLDRKNWVVSKEYISFIPKELRAKLNARVGDKDAENPGSGAVKKHTTITFACRCKGQNLVGVKDAPLFCRLPTSTTFGFPVLMNADISINKTGYAFNRKSAWNKVYIEIAGRLFAKWIADLSVRKEYTGKSILGIVPKFDKCIAARPDDKAFIELFKKGFREVIASREEKAEKAAAEAKEQQTATPAPTAVGKRFVAALPAPANTKGKIYVVDTNVFVSCPDIISKIGPDNTVIISAKVVDELDNLKYKMEDENLRDVQKALKNINQEIDNGNVRMELSDVSLLPRDFDRHNPDNNILSVVLRHKGDAPTLLSSDNGLQIKAKGLGLNVIGLKEFLAS